MSQATGKMVKARKILNAKRVSGALRQLYVKNEKESELLGLPPEIRNRIWEYVFGGHKIHIETRPPEKDAASKRRRICHTVCTVQTSDADSVEELRSNPSAARYADHSRHLECLTRFQYLGFGIRRFGPLHPTVNLSLLASCRQIHAEASLLPFSENEFAFGTLDDLDHFAKAILCEQASVIRSVSVRVAAHGRRRPINGGKRMDSIGTRIKRLDILTLFIELRYPHRNLPEEQHLRQAIVNDYVREYLDPGAKPILSVVVSIKCDEEDPWSGFYAAKPEWLSSAEIRLFEKKMEKDLTAIEA